jgi:hypothetical protein
MKNKNIGVTLGMAGFPADRFVVLILAATKLPPTDKQKELTMGKTLKLCAHKPFYFEASVG